MTIEFEMVNGVLRGYVIGQKGERKEFGGHKLSEFTGEGVTGEMIAAFSCGEKRGKKLATEALYKKLREVTGSA